MQKKRVLIVDDEATFTYALKMYIERTGRYEVATANSGINGISLARSWRPDIILLDIIMRDIDGDRVAAELRVDAHLKSVPIVFVTAITPHEPVGETCATEPPRVLTKPIDARDVLACIDSHLGPPSA